MKQASILFIILTLSALIFAPASLAGPQSTSYEIKDYGFGAGGASNITSTTYGLNGVAGELDTGSATSTTYQLGAGLTYTMLANTPGAPTVTNPSSYYDRLQIVLNTSSNPTDTTYAIQISTDSSFATNINYVKADNTIGTTLAATDYQTNSTWGASGFLVTTLSPNTTYYVRAKARQGNFTETGWGPSGNATTSTSSLTFNVDSSTITFANLNGGNSYTDSAKTNTLTTTTNAISGYTIYAKETQALTAPSGATISDYGSTNTSPTTWSGTGFGYTTSDSSLSGGTANRFSGSKYAGFVTSGNGDPVGDNTTPVTSDVTTISYRVTAPSTQTAGTYTNTILYTVVPVY